MRVTEPLWGLFWTALDHVYVEKLLRCTDPPSSAWCPEAGEEGCDFQHFGHCRPSETGCLVCWHSLLSEECDCSISYFATGLSCWCREIIAVEGVKAYFLLPKACKAFISAGDGHCCEVLGGSGALGQSWKRVKKSGSPVPPCFLPWVCPAVFIPTSKARKSLMALNIWEAFDFCPCF